MNKVLVISPHPDDEAIGCGGTIAKHIQDGDTVEVIFLTSGEKGGHGLSEKETSEVRENEAILAAKTLNVTKIDFWKETDGAFEANDKNVQRLIHKLKLFQPNTIYVPHGQEMHPDHRAAAELVKVAVGSLENIIPRPQVLMYEVWTPLQHLDQIIDISPYINIKRSAILVYKSQCTVMDFDEAILGLNRYRGEMHSWPGGDYAEVFMELKIVK